MCAVPVATVTALRSTYESLDMEFAVNQNSYNELMEKTMSASGSQIDDSVRDKVFELFNEASKGSVSALDIICGFAAICQGTPLEKCEGEMIRYTWVHRYPPSYAPSIHHASHRVRKRGWRRCVARVPRRACVCMFPSRAHARLGQFCLLAHSWYYREADMRMATGADQTPAPYLN